VPASLPSKEISGSRFGLGPARAPVPEGEAEMPVSDEVRFSSLQDAEATEGEEDTVGTDDASLNDAALIDNLEEDPAEVIYVIEDDGDDG
jgi:hypothetical protein